jgi:hypothetical protein
MRGAILSLLQYNFLVWCSVKIAQGQLYLFSFVLTVLKDKFLTFPDSRTSKTAVGFWSTGTLSISHCTVHVTFCKYNYSSSFLGSTAQLRPWPPPQNPAEFRGGFSTIFYKVGLYPTPNPHPVGPGLRIYIPQRQGSYPF